MRRERRLREVTAGHSLRFERTMVRKDRSTFEADISLTRLPNGQVYGMVRDVTDRKRAEDAIRTRTEQHAAAVRGSCAVVERSRSRNHRARIVSESGGSSECRYICELHGGRNRAGVALAFLRRHPRRGGPIRRASRVRAGDQRDGRCSFASRSSPMTYNIPVTRRQTWCADSAFNPTCVIR